MAIDANVDTNARSRGAAETDGLVIRETPPRKRERDEQSYAALQRELALRLNHLKAETREVCESYLANIEGDLSTLVEFLDGSSEVRRSRDAKAATMEAWIKILDAVSLKPHKGRRKDLRRIDQAVKALMRSAFE